MNRFYHHMAKSDVTIIAAMERRLSFLSSLDFEIRTAENSDPYLAMEQADVLRYAYDRIDNFKDATAFLATALFTGFAHLEKVYTGYGNLVSELVPVEPWFWIKKGMFGDWRFNAESRSHEAEGLAIDRASRELRPSQGYVSALDRSPPLAMTRCAGRSRYG